MTGWKTISTEPKDRNRDSNRSRDTDQDVAQPPHFLRRELKWECFGFVCFFSFFVYLLRETLLYGHTTFAHDNFYWHYPIFHYFAESILQGNFPWWNPYSHGGEPFYPLLVQVRLLEPLALLSVGLLRLFTDHIGILFAWTKLAFNLVFLFGVYWVLRSYADRLVTRLSLMLILLFSSLMLSSFAADAVVHHLLWVPYLYWLLNRIFYKERLGWPEAFGLSLLLGLNFQSYFFVIPYTLLLLFLAAAAIEDRKAFARFWKLKENRPKIIAVVFLQLLFLSPNLVLMLESRDFVFPARFLPQNYQTAIPAGSSLGNEGTLNDIQPGFLLNYAAIQYSGSFSSGDNYLQAFSPLPNHHLHTRAQGFTPWGKPSEVYFYIGVLPLLIALFGFFKARFQGAKRLRFFVLAFLFLSLGANTFVHRYGYYLLPPLWFLRHTQFFLPLVIFFLLFFYVWGMDVLAKKFSKVISVTLFSVIATDLLLSFNQVSVLYSYFYDPHWLLNTPTRPQRYQPELPIHPSPSFLPLNNPQSQSIRYLELLYRRPYAFSTIRTPFLSPDPLQAALKGVRWDSLLLLKNYFHTVNTTELAGVKRAFNLGRTPFELDSLPVSLKFLNTEPGDVSFEISPRQPGILTWMDTYSRYWIAKVDGTEVPIQPIYQRQKSIAIDSGRHRVHFLYDPIPFRYALWVFYSAFGICFAFIVLVPLKGISQFDIKRRAFRIERIVPANN